MDLKVKPKSSSLHQSTQHCTLGTLGGSSGHDCETVFFDLFRSGKYSKVHVNTCEHMLAHVNTCGHMLTHVKTCKKAVFEVWTMWFLDG